MHYSAQYCRGGFFKHSADDCGNVNAGITGGGTVFGASYDFDNGFTAAVVTGEGSSSVKGLMISKVLIHSV